MTKEEQKTRIEAELLSGAATKYLADKYSMPETTIASWKTKLNKESEDVKIGKLTEHTKASLEVIREVAKEQAPKAAPKIDKIIDGIEGLKQLEPEFHTAMSLAVKRAQEYLSEENTILTIKEWQLITSTLASAYGALFNKNGTTVNVANTQVNSADENLNFFKASRRNV